MTVNRTTLLDLPLPVTGTESGTWGDVTNNGLSQYVDIAVAGMTSLTSSDFTAGALTIANTQGDSGSTNIAAGSAQYATIKTSSLAANSTITAPASNRSYRIINADSTYTLTIKASGQTGVTFLPGTTGVVAFNGTDYEIVGVVGAASATDNAIPKFDGTTGQILQNTGVTIDDSNNVSGVAQLNATTADLTNIEVTNIKAKDGTAAGSIANSTGVVTLASSVLTTTDINGGTVDGVTIGGASAGAGTFTTLNTSGQVVFNDAGADVDFRVEGDTNANLLFVDASTDRVGIGTNAPGTPLEVNGGTLNRIASFVSTDSTSLIEFADDSTTNRPAVGAVANDLVFTAIAERMRVTSAGEVLVGGTTGIGFSGLTIEKVNTTPVLNFFRNDTTVSTGNSLGGIRFYGNDTTSNTTTQLAYIEALPSGTHGAGDNPTDLVFGTTPDGSETVEEQMRLTQAGGLALGTTSEPGAGNIRLTGRYLAGSTGVSTPDYSFSADGSMGMYRVPGSLCFATGGTERMRIDSSGNLLVGKTAAALASAGAEFNPAGLFYFTRASNSLGGFNRTGNDGVIVNFYQDGTAEGTISVSGTTVSYNGGHLSRWAQTLSAKDESLKKGTVLSNLDEMNVYVKPTLYWTEEDELPVDEEGNPTVAVGDVKQETSVSDNEQLNKVKVSDVEGDPNVAGVFVNWEYDEAHEVDEINMAMTGDMIIRIAEGVTVARGDLLMSAGDGTAKPQGDDIVRSKTIAKVTSTHVTCTYDDGSYCVPCVLMAC